MSMKYPIGGRALAIACIVAFGAAIAATSPVLAGSGGRSSAGDSYLNDEVRNPRLIEPYGYNDPSRYRASNPSAGYYDRQVSSGRYYYPARVTVRPYYR